MEKTSVMNEEENLRMPGQQATQVMPPEAGNPATDVMQGTLAMNEAESRNDVIAGSGTIITGSKGRYILEKELTDKTGEAVLYLCDNKETGEKCVAKIFRGGLKTKDAIIQFISGCKSDTILKLLDLGEYGGKHFEIYPYCSNGDLSRLVPLKPDFIKNVVVPCVNDALKNIHENGIIHRDIKPNNLFLNGDRTRVMVGDFGISSIMGNNQSTGVTVIPKFTFGYAAPEWLVGFRDINIITIEGDYYSFGITLVYLLTGHELFADIPVAQIILRTSSGDLPLPSGYDADIERLIRGLTRNDRKKRWGYELVDKWCRGEEIPDQDVPDDSEGDLFPKPYHFMDKQIYSSAELAEAFAKHWDEGVKQLYRGLVADFFKSFNQQRASEAQDCSEHYKNNPDLGLFDLLYILNPELELYWKGTIYKDMKDLARRMQEKLPEPDANYYIILRNGLVSRYIRSIKEISQQTRERIEVIEKLAVKDPEEAYLRFVFENLPENRQFFFRGIWYHNTEELIEAISGNADNLDSIAEELTESKYFLMWMEYLGYEKHVKLWKEKFAGQNTSRSLLYLLEASAQNPEKLRRILLEKIRSGSCYWLVKNIDRYSFISSEARQLQNTIKGIKLSEKMEITQLLEAERQLKDCVLSFKELCRCDPFTIKYNPEGGQASPITTQDHGSCLIKMEGKALFMSLDEFCTYKRIDINERTQVVMNSIETWKQGLSTSIQQLKSEIAEYKSNTLQKSVNTYTNARVGLTKAIFALAGAGFIAWCLYRTYWMLLYGSSWRKVGYFILAYIAIRFLISGVTELKHGFAKRKVMSCMSRLNHLERQVNQEIEVNMNTFADSLKYYYKNLIEGQTLKMEDSGYMNLRSASSLLAALKARANQATTVPTKRYLKSGGKLVWLVLSCCAAFYLTFGLSIFTGRLEIPPSLQGSMSQQADTPAPTMTGSETVEKKYYKVNASSGNIREKPSLNSKVVTSCSKGTRLEFLGESETDTDGRTWLHIQTQKGKIGWVSSKIVDEEQQ